MLLLYLYRPLAQPMIVVTQRWPVVAAEPK